ncbi:hypothetical protein DV737_g207, partial [Chaetothyriales sp. CBS 132003]
MGAILRLGGKERPSFLLKKLGLHNGEDASTKAKPAVNDGPLPAIAHIDTQSFVDFFDCFPSLNPNQEMNKDVSGSTDSSTPNLTNPAVWARQPSSTMLKAESKSKVGSVTQPSSIQVVARNDSTGSSSTTLSMRSTHLSPVTLNSSTSSFTEPPSPVVKEESPRRRSRSLDGMARLRDQPAPIPVAPQKVDTSPPAIQTCGPVDRVHQERAELESTESESIIYRIMYHLTEIKDLQSAALVSKGFMNTFKRNESTLVSHLMYQASKPAWELRRSILLLRRMKDFRLKEYVQDLQTLKGLKGLILDHCRSALNPMAIAGLSGENRPWGNGEVLNSDELDNVLGMWMCLQSLMPGFHGRLDEADRAGVFDNWSPELGWTREEHFQEWTAYLVTLGQTRSNFLTSTISHVYQERFRRQAAANAALAKVERLRHTLPAPSTSADSRLPVQYRHSSASVPHRHLSASFPYTAPVEIRPDCDPEIERRALNRSNSFFPATASNDPTLFHRLTAATTTASAKLGATLFPVNYTNQTISMTRPAGQLMGPGQSTLEVIDPVDQHLSLLVHQLGFPEANAKRALAMSDTGSGIDVRQAIELLLIESRQHEEPAANTPVELPTLSPLPNVDSWMKRHQNKSSDSSNVCKGDCKQRVSLSNSPTLRRRPASAAGGGQSAYPDSGHNGIRDEDGGKKIEQNINRMDKSAEAADEAMVSEIHGEQLDVVSPLASSSSMPLLSSMRCMGARKRWRVLRRGRPGCFTNDAGEHEEAAASPRDKGKGKATASKSSQHHGVVGMEEYERRIERRQSQRQMQQQEDFRGLGISPLGGGDGAGDGLGGLRQVGQGARASSGHWIKR